MTTRTRKTRLEARISPQMAAMLDEMIGAYGETRSEVVRFIMQHWMLHNSALIEARMEQYRKWKSGGTR